MIRAGKKRIKHYWGKDEVEARKLWEANIDQLVVDYAKLPDPAESPAASWSLNALALKYYRAKEIDGKSKSLLAQIRQYLQNESEKSMQFFVWLRAHGFDPETTGPGKLTTTLLATYREELGTNTAMGRVQANHYIANVRMLLHWGMEHHGLQHPPLGALKPFGEKAKAGHGRTQDRTPLTTDQLANLLAACDPVDRPIFLLGMNCGFGNMDIATLKLSDVDLEAGTISNSRQKTGAERDFVLWPVTVEAMKAYLLKHRGKHPRTAEIEQLFFVGRNGYPMVWEAVKENGALKRIDAVNCRWDALRKRASVKLPYGAGFYILRHTYATRIGEGSADLREVQAALGHSTIQQQQTYRHDMATKAKAAQERLLGQFSDEGSRMRRLLAPKSGSRKRKPKPGDESPREKAR